MRPPDLDDLTERLAEAERASETLRRELKRLRRLVHEARANLVAASAAEPRSFVARTDIDRAARKHARAAGKPRQDR